MISAPKISIVVPAYNVDQFLAQCLDSLLRQTYTNFEVIIVDDASTDDTPRIADDYSRRDARIRVLHKQHNEGLHLARRSGVQIGRGEWILFIDGDDEYDSDALTRVMRYCGESNNADFIRFGISVIPEDSAESKEARRLESTYNCMEGSLLGRDKLLSVFSDDDQHHGVWTVVATAFSASLCKSAFAIMSSRRLQRMEDAYEYFVLADQANMISLHTSEHILRYHWGRGITGMQRITSRQFGNEAQSMKDVVDAVGHYVQLYPSAAATSAFSWLSHEIPKHVSTTLALRVSPQNQERAMLEFAHIWDIDTALSQVYRLISDRAKDLTKANAMPSIKDELFRYKSIARTLELLCTYDNSEKTDNRGGVAAVEASRTQACVALAEHQKESNIKIVNAGSSKRRLAIYCFFDPNGHAATYIKPFLDDLRKSVSDIVVVSNGAVDEPTKELFAHYTDMLIERENKGLDIAAYREAMLTLGWNRLKQYDEVICLNDTIMGPVYPFAEMFHEMDKRDVDFWGITAYSAENINHESIPTHLQSYWHAYRKSLVSSQSFQEYWENLPQWTDYAEVTRRHEMQFTQHFENLGFTWSSYVDWHKYAGISSYPLLYMPVQLIRDDRCPVFKRRSFFVDYSTYFDQTAGQPALDLYDYLNTNTVYDVNLIWDALLQSYNVADLRKAMHLDYVLPSQTLNPSNVPRPKSAFIFHVYFMDMLNDTCQYLANVPEETDLYITTTEDKIPQIATGIKNFGIRKKPTFIPVKNRGRDVSALLVAARDVVLGGKYEVVGFAHDKKSSQNQKNGHHGTETQGFSYKLMENTLGSEQYVENILTLFAQNPRLGMVSPMPPYHALYFAHTLPLDWGPNFDITKDLLENTLDLHVPLDPAKPTMSAIGSCYWFRSIALKKLFEAKWTYDDFLSEEQMGVDGTISHAIERANGYVTQAAGYYPAWVMSDRYARIEVDSLLHTTNTLLDAMGSCREGETLLANANSLRCSLKKQPLLGRKFKHGIHRLFAFIAHVVTAPMGEKAKARFYNWGWRIVSKVLGR